MCIFLFSSGNAGTVPLPVPLAVAPAVVAVPPLHAPSAQTDPTPRTTRAPPSKTHQETVAENPPKGQITASLPFCSLWDHFGPYVWTVIRLYPCIAFVSNSFLLCSNPLFSFWLFTASLQSSVLLWILYCFIAFLDKVEHLWILYQLSVYHTYIPVESSGSKNKPCHCKSSRHVVGFVRLNVKTHYFGHVLVYVILPSLSHICLTGPPPHL